MGTECNVQLLLLYASGLLCGSLVQHSCAMNTYACRIHFVYAYLCQRMGGTLAIIRETINTGPGTQGLGIQGPIGVLHVAFMAEIQLYKQLVFAQMALSLQVIESALFYTHKTLFTPIVLFHIC